MRDSICYHRFPLAGVDAMTATTTRSFPRHTHDQYGIGSVDSGGHASWSGRGPVEAGPGHFITVNPAEVHDGRAIGHRGRSWRILYLDAALVAEVCTDVLEHLSATWMFAAPVFADGALRASFETAFAQAGADPANGMAGETAIVGLLGDLSVHSTFGKRPEFVNPCIRRARDRIDEDPSKTVTLVELAREAGMSRYQLIRGFKRELGLPPHAYLLQRRLALARRLVRAGRELAEAAMAAGFFDQSHLSRCFVRQFGVPPKRYASSAR